MLIKKKSLTLAVTVLGILLLVSLTACTGTGTGSTDPSDYSNTPISFADPVFENLLKADLNVSEISEADLAAYTGLTILGDKFVVATGQDKSIGSLTFYGVDTFELNGKEYSGNGTMETFEDLKHFPNLNYLYIYYQPSADYTTVPWEKIRLANLGYSHLESIDFLKAATRLWSLSLGHNEITDISVVANFADLKYLYIDWNDVSDLTALAGLTQLENFSCYDNQVSDLTPLENLTNLRELHCYENNIKDISVLSKLTNLKHIELINNQIEDVSPLAGFTGDMDRLIISGNPVKNLEVLSHIKILEYTELYP